MDRCFSREILPRKGPSSSFLGFDGCSMPLPSCFSVRVAGVPQGLAVHPSIAGPTQPLRGLMMVWETWRPILQVLGPLPARMGHSRLDTRIYLASRNLVPLITDSDSTGGGPRPSLLSRVERHAVLQDLVNAPQEHPRNNQAANLGPLSSGSSLICRFVSW